MEDQRRQVRLMKEVLALSNQALAMANTPVCPMWVSHRLKDLVADLEKDVKLLTYELKSR